MLQIYMCQQQNVVSFKVAVMLFTNAYDFSIVSLSGAKYGNSCP